MGGALMERILWVGGAPGAARKLEPSRRGLSAGEPGHPVASAGPHHMRFGPTEGAVRVRERWDPGRLLL